MLPAGIHVRGRRVDLVAAAGLLLWAVGEWRVWRLLMQRPVRTVRVVVLDVFLEHLRQVSWPSDQHVVEAFAAQRADEALGDRVPRGARTGVRRMRMSEAAKTASVALRGPRFRERPGSFPTLAAATGLAAGYQVIIAVVMLRKKTIRESIAFPTVAPAPAGLGRIKTTIKRMMVNAQSHRGMGYRLLPVVGQRQVDGGLALRRRSAGLAQAGVGRLVSRRSDDLGQRGRQGEWTRFDVDRDQR